HPGQIDLLQRMHAVSAVAAVKFRQMHAKRAIFEKRENAVPHVFIKRHAALARAPVVLHHARAEDGVSLAGDKRIIYVSQDLWSILSVAVKQHGDIEALFDEISITRFLVAAITQVTFMLQDLEFAVRRKGLETDG